MYNHGPKNYVCPFCQIINGKENEQIFTKQQDIFYKDKDITTFISSHWWPNNPGSIIIVCNKHFENIYDVPDDIWSKLLLFAKKVAVAIKQTYKCDGISIRQHNEPAGNQDIWHLHVAVFPRYTNDKLYERHKEKKFIEQNKRVKYATLLKKYFSAKNNNFIPTS